MSEMVDSHSARGPDGLEDLFAAELATFRAALPGLLNTDLGRWALVKGGEIVVIMDTENDALDEGYREFGNVPFLVERIDPNKLADELGGVVLEAVD